MNGMKRFKPQSLQHLLYYWQSTVSQQTILKLTYNVSHIEKYRNCPKTTCWIWFFKIYPWYLIQAGNLIKQICKLKTIKEMDLCYSFINLNKIKAWSNMTVHFSMLETIRNRINWVCWSRGLWPCVYTTDTALLPVLLGWWRWGWIETKQSPWQHRKYTTSNRPWLWWTRREEAL